MYAQGVHQDRIRNGIIAAEPGIESELRGDTPRRVVDSKLLREWRAACANGVVGTLLGTWYFYTHLQPMPGGLLMVCLFFAGVFAMLWIAHESEAKSDRKLLRYGNATRATVEKRDIILGGSYAVYMVTYSYKRRDGKWGRGHISVREQVAKSIGGLAVGQRFTVLSYPDDPNLLIPYFKVAYAMIPGAAPVRTTPRDFPDDHGA
jgi:hypothetical protein